MSFEQIIQNMDEQIYQRLQQAIAIGRWADGVRLTEQQLENSMQLVIGWQLKHGISPLPAATDCSSPSSSNQVIPVISKG